MQITLEFPDDVAQGLEAQVKNLPRALLESFALEGYRSGKLTEEQVRRGFLKEHDVYLNYSLEDLEQDMQTLRQLREREPAHG